MMLACRTHPVRTLVWVAACVALVSLAGCGASPPAPAALDTRNDLCAHCRMTVSNPEFAAQIVASGEEPRFFDDVGCLRAYLEGGAALPAGSAVFVASYRTRAWIPAGQAMYVKDDGIETPMGSHYVSFANGAERDGRPQVSGTPLSAADVFGSHLRGSAAR